MSEPHTPKPADGVAAVLFAAAVGAGLALFLRAVAEARNYSPVDEAQRVARKALGLED